MYQVDIFSTTHPLNNKTASAAILKSNNHQKTVTCIVPTMDRKMAEFHAISKAVSSLKKPEHTTVKLYSLQNLSCFFKNEPAEAKYHQTIRELKEKLKKCKQVIIAKNTLKYQYIFNQAKITAMQIDKENKATTSICDKKRTIELLRANLPTWKNNIPPTPKEIESSPSLEHFLAEHLESPDYGTRTKITDIPLIKAIIEKVEGYKGRDRSHYNGYDPQIERKAEIETITLKVDEEFYVLKNGKRIDCNLKDKYFDGMRINIITNHTRDMITRFQILLDFFYPDEGYRKKCVIFDIKPKTQIALKKENVKKQNIYPDKTQTTPQKGSSLIQPSRPQKQLRENCIHAL